MSATTRNLFSANTFSLSLLSPILKLSSSSSPILRPSSPPFVSLSLHKRSYLYPLPLRALSSSNDAVSAANDEEEFAEFEEEDGGFEEEEEEVDDDGSDGQDFGFDVDALEREAKDAVREYSSSLSRELKIGAFYLNFTTFVEDQKLACIKVKLVT